MKLREPENQLRARQAIERALNRRLRLFELEPNGDNSLDYIDEHNDVFEMKDVTSEELRHLLDQKRKRGWFPSTKLAMHWSVLLDAPTMGDKFRPTPGFSDDDPESIAAIEAEGYFTVKRKAEREAEWREQFSGRKHPVPRIRARETKALERHLLVLEQAGVSNTREAQPRTSGQRHALAQIRLLTHGGICIAHEPFDGEAGIEINVGWGYARTGHPDALAFRVQAWLDSDASSNLRDSLRRSEFALRHGVLTFDSSEPEYMSAQEAGPSFVPIAELTMPPEIDVLWCLVGGLLLRYEPSQGWESFTSG